MRGPGRRHGGADGLAVEPAPLEHAGEAALEHRAAVRAVARRVLQREAGGQRGLVQARDGVGDEVGLDPALAQLVGQGAGAGGAVLEALRHPPVGERGVVDELQLPQAVDHAADVRRVGAAAGQARRQLAARPRAIAQPLQRLGERDAIRVLRPHGRDGVGVQHLAAPQAGRQIQADAERILTVEVHVHAILVGPLQLQRRDDLH